MRKLLISPLIGCLLACGLGEDETGGNTSNLASNEVIININDPRCELETVRDCDQFLVQLLCSGNLAGSRAATCNECPNSDTCAVPEDET